jgi:competence transcription factor ComK
MNYIINSKHGCNIYQKDNMDYFKGSSISYIKQLCQKHLFTFEGYLKSCRAVFKYKYKIPLYITDSIQLIPTKSAKHMDVIWINYAQIKHFMVKNQNLLLVFHDGMEKMIEMSEIAWIKQIKRLDMIKSYKVKHFHS